LAQTGTDFAFQGLNIELFFGGNFMKSFLMVFSLLMVGQAAMAKPADYVCTNNDSNYPVTVKMDFAPIGFKNARIRIDDAKYTFPKAEYDPTYRPRNNKNSVRFLMVTKEGKKAPFAFITSRIIHPEFRAVVVEIGAGYHGENIYNTVDCVNNGAIGD
jgi:hypothetical protein